MWGLGDADQVLTEDCFMAVLILAADMPSLNFLVFVSCCKKP